MKKTMFRAHMVCKKDRTQAFQGIQRLNVQGKNH